MADLAHTIGTVTILPPNGAWFVCDVYAPALTVCVLHKGSFCLAQLLGPYLPRRASLWQVVGVRDGACSSPRSIVCVVEIRHHNLPLGAQSTCERPGVW